MLLISAKRAALQKRFAIGTDVVFNAMQLSRVVVRLCGSGTAEADVGRGLRVWSERFENEQMQACRCELKKTAYTVKEYERHSFWSTLIHSVRWRLVAEIPIFREVDAAIRVTSFSGLAASI